MTTVATVAVRELVAVLSRRSFYISTIGVPILLVVIFAAISLVGRSATTSTLNAAGTTSFGRVGVVDEAHVLQRLPPEAQRAVVFYQDEASAAAALDHLGINAYFVVGPDYPTTSRVTRVSRQASFINVAGADVQLIRQALLLNLIGDPQLAARIEDPATFKTTIVAAPGAGAAATQPGTDGVRAGIAFGFAAVLCISLLSGGGLLVSSIGEEKENRTIELLLTTLRPWQLFAGKLVGLGIAGLVQLAILLAIGRGLLGGVQAVPIAGPTVDNATIPLAMWLWAIALFLLGYLLYGALMAILAAIGSSARESGQISSLLTLPVMAPVWLLATSSERADGPLGRALALFPLTAPTTLMLRLGMGPVPLWELVAAVLLLVLAIVALLALAARLFKATTLLTGMTPTPRAIWHALRSG